MTTHQKLIIPDFLKHLKTYHGFPIPYSNFVNKDGVPDFTQINHEKWIDCVSNKKCGVCGYELYPIDKGSKVFLGGDQSLENRLFMDPAMHYDCALYSAYACCYIAGHKQNYREVPKQHEEVSTTVYSFASTKRPELFGFLACKDYELVKYQDSFLIRGIEAYPAKYFLFDENNKIILGLNEWRPVIRSKQEALIHKQNIQTLKVDPINKDHP